MLLFYKFIKRVFDLLFALIAVILSFPIVLISALAIKFTTEGPVFFVQKRPGFRGRIFNIYKLRTMTTITFENGKELTDFERLTPLGRVIRKFSIDELPQLWNILKGEMSFIGPRPLLVEYLKYYTVEQNRRHDVLPGITGWAQVNGRNTITWEQKFKHDIFYVDNISFLLDLKIILLTVKNVISSKDINQSENVVMPKFKGEEG